MIKEINDILDKIKADNDSLLEISKKTQVSYHVLDRFTKGSKLYSEDFLKLSRYYSTNSQNLEAVVNLDKDKASIETIRDLARSSVVLAEANKILADNNTQLITLFHTTTVNDRSGNRPNQTLGETLAPYLYKMANAGVNKKLWETADEGLIALGKLLAEDEPVMQK